MTYKKRAKAGWNKDKDVSNRKERTFEKELIEKEVESQEIDDSKTVEPEDKFVSSGRRTGKKKYKYPEEREIHRLEKRIGHNEKHIRIMEQYEFLREDSWLQGSVDRSKSEIRKDQAKLEKLQKKLEEKKRNE